MRALLLAGLLGLGAPARASDPDRPHPHQGIAPKFTNPKPTALTPDEEARLRRGELVRRQVRYGDEGGRGIAIQDVHASPDRIWEVILDFERYPQWVDHLEETEVYRRDGDDIYVRFKLSVFMMDVEYWIHHTWNRERGFMTWQLDYSKTSDLDDSTGYWLVYPAPGRPSWSRVEYTVDLRLKGWVPGVVEDLLANKGLEQATAWVKRQAERS